MLERSADVIQMTHQLWKKWHCYVIGQRAKHRAINSQLLRRAGNRVCFAVLVFLRSV